MDDLMTSGRLPPPPAPKSILSLASPSSSSHTAAHGHGPSIFAPSPRPVAPSRQPDTWEPNFDSPTAKAALGAAPGPAALPPATRPPAPGSTSSGSAPSSARSTGAPPAAPAPVPAAPGKAELNLKIALLGGGSDGGNSSQQLPGLIPSAVQLGTWDPFSADEESAPVFDVAAAKAGNAVAQQVEEWAPFGSPTDSGAAAAGQLSPAVIDM